MGEIQSELQAFVILCIFLMVASPAAAWSVMPRSQHEHGTRLWFLGAACLASVGVIYYLNSRWVTAFFTANLAAAAFAIEALAQERRPRPIPGLRLVAIIAGSAFCHAASNLAIESGWLAPSQQLGIRVLLLTAVELWIVTGALRLARERRSRGLVLVALGLAPLVLANAARLAAIVGGSTEMGPEATSRAFPILASLLTLTAVTYSFGFLAYTLEKTHARASLAQANQARAQEREATATAYNRELQQLIDQRDELLMSNTRLSAMSAMGLYNAAIVHEISQPLQAQRSVLDSARLHLARHVEAPSSAQALESVDQAIALNGKVSDVIQSLRRLIAARPARREALSPHEAIRTILPVLQAECRRRNIRLDVHLAPEFEDARVEGDPLLLQRTVMNLVANSMDALSTQAEDDRHIQVTTLESSLKGRPAVCLRIDDSGPGLSAATLGNALLPLATGKPDGMGMGLTLARLIMDAWRGALHLGTSDSNGARVDLLMPKA